MNDCQQLAARSLTTACKCHGVSGSCSMKTCWKALPDLRSVAVTLLDRYSFAVEVSYRRVSRRKSAKSTAAQTTTPSNAVNSPPAKRLVPVLRRRRTLNDTDIAYYTMSPDYCLPDLSLGSIGTKDRYNQLRCVTKQFFLNEDDFNSQCTVQQSTLHDIKCHYRATLCVARS